MSLGSDLSKHLRRSSARPGAPELCQGLLSAELSVDSLIAPWLGQTIQFDGGAVIELPQSLQWIVVRNDRAIDLAFQTPRPVVRATKWKLLRIRAEITGLSIGLDQITIRLAGFPDFTLSIDWRPNAKL